MNRFAALFAAIDQSTKTTVKVAALADYFRDAPEGDRIWTIALFSGRRPKRAVTTTRLREWAAERADIPLWLFEEAYPIVGDLAETIALVLPPPAQTSDRSLSYWINALRGLADVDEADKKTFVLNAWDMLPPTHRFLFNKLLTGGFRVGISQKLMTRALARATDRDEAELAHRLMGDWDPATITWEALIEADAPAANASRPYPFYLAYQLDGFDDLGPPADWNAEGTGVDVKRAHQTRHAHHLLGRHRHAVLQHPLQFSEHSRVGLNVAQLGGACGHLQTKRESKIWAVVFILTRKTSAKPGFIARYIALQLFEKNPRVVEVLE